MIFSCDGLVIRSVDYGENDKIITLLTPDRGKLSISVKGAKSVRTKWGGATSVFAYGNYTLYKKGDFHYLREASVTAPFFGLTRDILKMSLASYMCDVACDVTGEDVPAPDVLRLTLNSFHAMVSSDKPLSLIKAAFELRAAAFSGFAPDLTGCFICGEPNPREPIFDIMNGHVFCRSCLRSHPEMNKPDRYNPEQRIIMKNLTPSTLAAIRYAISAPPARALSFELKDDEELRIFEKVAQEYLLNHLERGFDTLDFYLSML